MPARQAYHAGQPADRRRAAGDGAGQVLFRRLLALSARTLEALVAAGLAAGSSPHLPHLTHDRRAGVSHDDRKELGVTWQDNSPRRVAACRDAR